MAATTLSATQPMSDVYADNALLNRMVEDLQSQLASVQQGGAGDDTLIQKLRQTEDALLEQHTEYNKAKAVLQHQHQALLSVQRDRQILQQTLQARKAHDVATEQILAAEITNVEASLHAEVQQSDGLRTSSDEALRGMHAAQRECNWLHEQLQTVLQDKEEGSGGARSSSALVAREAAAATGHTSIQATRTAYVKAVQRCHELQMHAARAAEAEATLRPDLLAAMERVCALHTEVDTLRRHSSAAIAGSLHALTMGDVVSSSAAVAEPHLATLNPQHTRLNHATPAGRSDFASPPLREPSLSRIAPPRPVSHLPTSKGGGSAHAPRRMSGGAPMSGGGGVAAISTPRNGASPATAATAAIAEAAALRTELVRANSHISELQTQLERRQTEHHEDLSRLCAAQRDAAECTRTLQSERAWVAALDDMRLDGAAIPTTQCAAPPPATRVRVTCCCVACAVCCADLMTIQMLESKLDQWKHFHGGE